MSTTSQRSRYSGGAEPRPYRRALRRAPLSARELSRAIVGLALLASLLAWAPAGGAPAPGARLKVAATIFPLADIVRQVAAGVADVTLLLPPGASPHTFEPTPAGVRALTGARALFVIGHGLDDWAVRLARGAGVVRVVPVDAGIPLRRFRGAGDEEPGRRPGGIDPHYWLSAVNGQAMARTIAAEVERLAPEQSVAVRRGLDAYLLELERADAEIRRLLGDLPMRRIATFHAAFGYFADAYGLEVAAVFEPFPGKEPGPRFVQDFQRTVRATGVRVLFTEPQLSVDTLRPIARDLGVALSVLDPLGGVAGRGSYIDLLLFNARQVAAATRGQTR